LPSTHQTLIKQESDYAKSIITLHKIPFDIAS